MRRLSLAVALAIPLLAGAAATTTTQATTLPQAASCSGVWVVVDFGSLGGTSTKCATSYGTGTKALRSAGFAVTVEDGFVLSVGGKPGNPDPNTAYWSYWHATPDSGGWSSWSYSNLGADSYHPKKGDAEGWRYQKLSDGKVSPGVKPPAAAPQPSPTPSKTSTKPSAKPTKTASKTPSASASKSTATKTATAKTTGSASAQPSPTPSATPASAESTPLGANQATPVPQQVDQPAPDPAAGSPVGLIVAGVAIVLAGGGLGVWWLRKGRRP